MGQFPHRRVLAVGLGPRDRCPESVLQGRGSRYRQRRSPETNSRHLTTAGRNNRPQQCAFGLLWPWTLGPRGSWPGAHVTAPEETCAPCVFTSLPRSGLRLSCPCTASEPEPCPGHLATGPEPRRRCTVTLSRREGTEEDWGLLNRWDEPHSSRRSLGQGASNTGAPRCKRKNN